MHFSSLLTAVLLFGCTSAPNAAPKTLSSFSAPLTPTSAAVAGIPTWIDEVMAVASRDPHLQPDSIIANTRKQVSELRWMEGTWTDHYRLFATPKVPERRRDVPVFIASSRGGLWLVVRDSGGTIDIVRYLSFDPTTKKWKLIEVGIPTYASYAETSEDWKDGRLVFEYAMALEPYIGHALRQRETWSRLSRDEWSLTVEQRLSDGRYVFIEESRYERDTASDSLSRSRDR